MTSWPTQASVLAGTSPYGNPRSRTDPAKSSAAWEAQNLTYVVAPFRMFYAGKPLSRGMKVHKHCADSTDRIMQALWRAARQEQDTIDEWGMSIYGGGHVFRLMTGGRSLSMHSYGCALDFDPPRNGWKDRTPRFRQFPAVLDAFAREGWKWGGDWDGDGRSDDERYCDGMHWQATR